MVVVGHWGLVGAMFLYFMAHTHTHVNDYRTQEYCIKRPEHTLKVLHNSYIYQARWREGGGREAVSGDGGSGLTSIFKSTRM